MSDARFQFDQVAVVGNDHPIILSFYDRDSDTGVETPEDLSDRLWTYMAKATASDADGDAIITLTSAGGTITIESDGNATKNPTNVTNQLSMILPKATTATMSVRRYTEILNSVTDDANAYLFTKGLGELAMIIEDTDGGY